MGRKIGLKGTQRGELCWVCDVFFKKKKKTKQGLPERSGVRTSPSNARALTPGWGAEIPHASRQKQTNKPAKHKAGNIVKNSINTLRKVDIKKILSR